MSAGYAKLQRGDGTFSGRARDITSSMTGATGCAGRSRLLHGDYVMVTGGQLAEGAGLLAGRAVVVSYESKPCSLVKRPWPFHQGARAAMRKRQSIALSMSGR